MADQVKVFQSGTLTGADITNSNEIELVQTDSTTKAVVKDIVLTSTAPLLNGVETPATIELYNDNVKLADFDSVTGSEIIDTSSKLYYKITPTPTISGNLGYSTAGTTSYVIPNATNVSTRGTSPTVKTNDVVTNYALRSDTSLIINNFDPTFTGFTTTSPVSNTIPSMSNAAFYLPSLDGNTAWYYYWNGNNVTSMYKTTATNGIATGNWVTYTPSASYEAWSLDIDNNVLVSGRNSILRMLDPETSTETTKTMVTWPGTSSYTASAACNNYFFFFPSQSYASSIYFTPIDTVTTAASILSLPTSVTFANYTFFAACYNPFEDKYYFLAGTTDANKKVFTATGSQISTGGSQTATEIFPTFNFALKSNAFIHGDKGGHFYLKDSSSTTNYKVKMENDSASIVSSFDQASQAPTGWVNRVPASTSTTAAALDDLAIDITCKVSGVEITGV